jgi:hypothetical protein
MRVWLFLIATVLLSAGCATGLMQLDAQDHEKVCVSIDTRRLALSVWVGPNGEIALGEIQDLTALMKRLGCKKISY